MDSASFSLKDKSMFREEAENDSIQRILTEEISIAKPFDRLGNVGDGSQRHFRVHCINHPRHKSESSKQISQSLYV